MHRPLNLNYVVVGVAIVYLNFLHFIKDRNEPMRRHVIYTVDL